MKNLIILFLILFLRISYANELLIDKTVAIVDNEVILKSDVDFIIKICKLENISVFDNIDLLELKKNILKQLICNKLIYKIFSGKNIIISNNNINDYIKNTSNNILLNKKEFMKILFLNNIDIRRYRDFVKNKLIIKKIFKDKIIPLITISNEELNECIYNINNNNKINNLFLKYNIDIIKISNNKKYNLNSIEEIKKVIFGLLKNKKKFYNNIKISKNLYIDNVEIKNIKNILFKDFPMVIFTNFFNIENIDNTIRSMCINNFIYFIKINLIKEKLYKNNLIKRVNIINFYVDKFNNINNKNKNLNIINNFYNKIINNNFYYKKDYKNNLLKNIKIENLGWENIDYYDKYLKSKIINLKNKKFSKPFEYKNRWIFLLLNDSKIILYDDYIKEEWAKKFLLKNKSLFLIKNIVNDFKKNIYIKILDKKYYIDI